MTTNHLQTHVVIIGAGLAGLACAVALRDSGLRVRVFESSQTAGGRARSWTDSHTGDVIDIGPHILLSEYRNMLALLQLLGTNDRVAWQTEKLIRLREGHRVTDMRLSPLPAPFHLLPSFARAPSVGWRDILSNRRVLWIAMRATERRIESLHQLRALDLLRQCGVTARFIEWFWASACMSVLNVPLERCSAGALMRVFNQLAGLQRYAIGFATVGLADLFVPQAIRLIEGAGGSVQLNLGVQRIDCDNGQFKSIVLVNGERIDARICVAAVPPEALARMLPEDWRQKQPFSASDVFEPSPYVSTYLWFDRKITGERFWARIWNPAGLNTDFYDLANIRDGWRGQQRSLIASNTIYSHRAENLSDAEIVAATVSEIQEAFPDVRAGDVRHAVVNRISMAIPCPTPQSERQRPATTTPITGLMLAGDWTDTRLPACMESAVHSGWAAAQQIWRQQGSPRQIVLPKREPEGIAGLIYKLPA